MNGIESTVLFNCLVLVSDSYRTFNCPEHEDRRGLELRRLVGSLLLTAFGRRHKGVRGLLAAGVDSGGASNGPKLGSVRVHSMY